MKKFFVMYVSTHDVRLRFCSDVEADNVRDACSKAYSIADNHNMIVAHICSYEETTSMPGENISDSFAQASSED